jgi:hypothetical protein
MRAFRLWLRQGFADAPTQPRTVFEDMKIEDYRSLLRAVEQAIQICDESSGVMDKTHQDICAELRTTRARLRRLISQDAFGET